MIFAAAVYAVDNSDIYEAEMAQLKKKLADERQISFETITEMRESLSSLQHTNRFLIESENNLTAAAEKGLAQCGKNLTNCKNELDSCISNGVQCAEDLSITKEKLDEEIKEHTSCINNGETIHKQDMFLLDQCRISLGDCQLQGQHVTGDFSDCQDKLEKCKEKFHFSFAQVFVGTVIFVCLTCIVIVQCISRPKYHK